MPEPIASGVLLAAALVAAFAGMGWLAVAMPAHGQQVWGRAVAPRTARRLRAMGAGGLVVSLLLCLAVDHASMAVLVWVMALAGAALLVALVLAWRPRWLRGLAPGMGAGARAQAASSR